MSKKQKRLKRMGAVLLLLTAVFLTGFKAQNDVKIYVNGKFVKSDQPPLIFENRTFVPVRVIAEGLGAKVEYHREDMTVTIEKNNTNILLAIGDDTAWYSDEVKAGPVLLDETAFIRNNRTYIPLRAISELFYMDVNWDAKKRAVYINDKSLLDYIDENNAGDEVIERLQKLSIIGHGRFYMDVSDYKVNLDGTKDEGYFVTIRKDNPFDEELTELVGHYFINETGTMVLKYDVVNDTYERIY
ncbi:copper amine oxidase N-terminal domain-containing protein [Peptoniphilus duerdenii]|uniref:copper amine oxidase N-terminal domain-containing protein n=1 Tax=Peptoniphilus duerdenii TaxID=507750 RepID=UPI00288A8B6B|nr:copper amine oxidase N-terminal domain-containing protein [Peptoniphilus duerdenii]